MENQGMDHGTSHSHKTPDHSLLLLIKPDADGLIKVSAKLPGHLLPPNVSGL